METDKSVQYTAPVSSTEATALLLPDQQGADGHAGLLSTTANVLCTMIGGGMLALPFAFSEASAVWAVATVLVSVTFCSFAVYLLVVSCEATGTYTFRELLQAAFPSVGARRVGIGMEMIVVLGNTAALTAYARIIGDAMPPVLRGFASIADKSVPDLLTRSGTWTLSFASVFLLLAPTRRLHDIWWLSAAGFLAVVYVGVVVVTTFGIRCHNDEAPSSDVQYFSLRSTLLPAFSIITGALMYQMNVPPLYQEMAHRSRRRMMTTTAAGYCTATVMYIVVGLTGYLTFGRHAIADTAEGNILNNFSSSDLAMNIGRLLMCVHFVFVFPIYVVVARRSLHVSIYGNDDADLKHRLVEGWLLVGVGVGMALIIPGIGTLCQFTGAIFGTTIALTLPGLIYHRLYDSVMCKRVPSPEAVKGDAFVVPHPVTKTLALVLSVTGLLTTVCSVGITISNLV